MVLTEAKGPPYASLGLQASIMRNQDKLMAAANSVQYPVLMVLAEKDVIVSNKVARAWYDKIGTKVKKVRLMAGSYHSTIKEPNNDVFFESTLNFMGERLDGKVLGKPAKPFGAFVKGNPAVRYYKPVPATRKKRFWIFLLVIIYLIVGFIKARRFGMKRLLLTWPTKLSA